MRIAVRASISTAATVCSSSSVGRDLRARAAASGPDGPEIDASLERTTPRGRLGASARLTLPEERDGYLELERFRGEPFSDADLAIARLQARRLVPCGLDPLRPRPIAWSSQLDAVQSVAAQLTRLSSVRR